MMKADKKSRGSFDLIKRMLHVVKPYKKWVAICIVASLFTIFIDIYSAYLIQIISEGALKDNFESLIRSVLILAGLTVVGLGITYVSGISSGRFSIFAMRDFKRDMTHHMMKLTVPYIERNHTGDLLSRYVNDSSLIQEFLNSHFVNLIYLPLAFLGTSVYMILINWKLFASNMVLMGLLLVITTLISKPIIRFYEDMQKYFGKVNSIAEDTLSGIAVVKSYNLKEKMFEKYRDSIVSAVKRVVGVQAVFALITPFLIIINILPLAVTILLGGYLSVTGKMPISSLIVYTVLLEKFTHVAGQIPELINHINITVGASKRIFEMLDEREERTSGECFMPETGGCPVQFADVDFSYHEETKVLDGVNFKLRTGKMTAIVGLSGSGKSTIVKLLTGFYEARSGIISIHGHKIDDWDPDTLRLQIAVVSQDTYLFPTTLAKNIAYGKKGATLNEIVEAAKAADIHEFIMSLPEGYHTMAGERGCRLSGGQKQRIAIARAMIRNASILILDEPTASLDTHSESVVEKTLEKVSQGRTVLVISHRLSAIKNADEVLVLDEGRIIETGTHKDLMEQNGRYKQLYSKQLSKGYSDEELLA